MLALLQERGLFPPAVACSICLFPRSDNPYAEDEDEEAEEFASESAGFRDKSIAPVANIYPGQQKFGVHANDVESGYQAAPSQATSTGSTATDTPTLTVQCRKESFQIALRAGRLSAVKVKGMCQGAFKYIISHPPKLLLDNL